MTPITESTMPAMAAGNKPTAAFPHKKEGKHPTMKTMQSKVQATAPTLTVCGFHENIDIEAYLFCKDDHNDGYTWG